MVDASLLIWATESETIRLLAVALFWERVTLRFPFMEIDSHVQQSTLGTFQGRQRTMVRSSEFKRSMFQSSKSITLPDLSTLYCIRPKPLIFSLCRRHACYPCFLPGRTVAAAGAGFPPVSPMTDRMTPRKVAQILSLSEDLTGDLA